jgi:hypothetical protein
MSQSSQNYKRNDHVEALWPEDGAWYPARVLQARSNGVFLIRFDGFVEKYMYPQDRLRACSRNSQSASNHNSSSTGERGARSGGNVMHSPTTKTELASGASKSAAIAAGISPDAERRLQEGTEEAVKSSKVQLEQRYKQSEETLLLLLRNAQEMAKLTNDLLTAQTEIIKELQTVFRAALKVSAA